MQRHFNIISSVFVLLGSFSTSAGARVDSLRLSYDFNASIETLSIAIQDADSLQRILLENELLLSSNGKNMMDYCSRPVVVGKETFSLEDYHLYYPLEDRSWRPLPNVLDSAKKGNKFLNALYAPTDTREIYYSAEDSDGIRNIYRTSLKDSIWSLPKLINENVTSCSNEITPFISEDGKSLYFASEGLYGMGGYDLYVSHWDEKTSDWGIPTNMGFPYSTPYDDFLYITDAEGKYAFFASNRNCSKDSVTVYVVEYDPVPVRTAVTDSEELKKLCSMEVAESLDSKLDFYSPLDENSRLYMEKMRLVRTLKDSLDRENNILEELRKRLSSEGDDEDKSVTKRIVAGELRLPSIQENLKTASAELQKIELEFLMNGVNLSTEEISATSGTNGTSQAYTFRKRKPGPDLSINVEVPEIKFDYSFKILDEAVFAEDNTLPDGLIYQIKLFTLSRKATGPEKFKGLSPVFEQTPSKGKFAYSVGLFYSYNDALSKLNKVKKLGFKDAIIAAHNSGKTISISSARNIEKNKKTYYRIKIYPENGESLPDYVINAIHSVTDSDILKTLDGAAIVFELGPFDSKEKVDEIKEILITSNVTNINVYVDNSFPDSVGHSSDAH